MTLFPPPALAPHTTLQCTRCQKPVAVLQAPDGHIDPERYVCPDCLWERHRLVVERREQRPAVAYNEFPAGY